MGRPIHGIGTTGPDLQFRTLRSNLETEYVRYFNSTSNADEKVNGWKRDGGQDVPRAWGGDEDAKKDNDEQKRWYLG